MITELRREVKFSHKKKKKKELSDNIAPATLRVGTLMKYTCSPVWNTHGTLMAVIAADASVFPA